jgi:hypothetical protein
MTRSCGGFISGLVGGRVIRRLWFVWRIRCSGLSGVMLTKKELYKGCKEGLWRAKLKRMERVAGSGQA